MGLGLMGSSLALALHEARPELSVAGVDADPAVAGKARRRGNLAEVGTDLSMLWGCDLLVLAVPIASMREALEAVAGRATVTTDVASTKAQVMAWAAGAGVDLVGGHPMCGRELSGIDAADARLFQDAPWILTRAEPSVKDLVEAVGARPLVMDAAEHDRLVAGVSHVAFALSAAYVLALARSPDWEGMAELAAGGFRDMTRLASGDPAMYEAIARTNAANLDRRLGEVAAVLDEMRRKVAAGDARLIELFAEAKNVRDRWAAGS